MNKKYLDFRTDMADERVDVYKKVHNLSEIDGIKVETTRDENTITTVVDVLNKNGEEAVKKEIGRYVTIEIEDLNNYTKKEKDIMDDIANNVCMQIKNLIPNFDNKSILVVGLGNEEVTPDALRTKSYKKS